MIRWAETALRNSEIGFIDDALIEDFASGLPELRVSGPTSQKPGGYYRKEKRILSDRHGGLSIFGWFCRAPWMKEYLGLHVEIWFKPHRLEDGAEIFTVRGRYLGHAQLRPWRPTPEGA